VSHAHSPFIPEDFLIFAEKLLISNDFQDSEASYRAIINRCYLSAVLKAAQMLEPVVGEFDKTIEFYRQVENGLSNRDAPISKNRLGTLRGWRNSADYRIAKQVSQEMAQYAVDTARDVLEIMKTEIK
jgi:hypothetical protein